jgi:ribosomal subunit interface protein
MQIPIEIRFDNLDPSPAIETAVHDRAGKLEQFADHIVSCHVTIASPHKHHRQGRLYTVKVDVRLPGGELVVSREPSADHAHEDVYVALRDAFNATRRRLQDHVNIRRGHVKSHDAPSHGRIRGLRPDRDFGFIETPDGREIYFHAHSVVNAAFEKLEDGQEVRFSEEQGDEGPQATSVHIIGKHHIVD